MENSREVLTSAKLSLRVRKVNSITWLSTEQMFMQRQYITVHMSTNNGTTGLAIESTLQFVSHVSWFLYMYINSTFTIK